jgi:hypothetical protein
MASVNKWMIDPRDAVLLLIDHQSGLFQLVKDIELPVLRANVTALAKMAHSDHPSRALVARDSESASASSFTLT